MFGTRRALIVVLPTAMHSGQFGWRYIVLVLFSSVDDSSHYFYNREGNVEKEEEARVKRKKK